MAYFYEMINSNKRIESILKVTCFRLCNDFCDKFNRNFITDPNMSEYTTDVSSIIFYKLCFACCQTESFSLFNLENIYSQFYWINEKTITDYK